MSVFDHVPAPGRRGTAAVEAHRAAGGMPSIRLRGRALPARSLAGERVRRLADALGGAAGAADAVGALLRAVLDLPGVGRARLDLVETGTGAVLAHWEASPAPRAVSAAESRTLTAPAGPGAVAALTLHLLRGRAPLDTGTAAHLLLTIAAPVVAALSRLDESRRDALVDELTGLGNRRALERAMARHRGGRRTDVETAVVVIDCDGLKGVNDRDGHAAGDAVIRAVGRALRSSLRAGDLAVRAGGDEFVLLLPGAGGRAATEAMARVGRRLQTELARTSAPPVGLSAGIAVARGDEDLDPVQRRADAAMYRAKRRRGAERGPAVSVAVAG